MFPNSAFYKGQTIAINEHDFFKFRRIEAKSLAKNPDIQLNTKLSFNPFWYSNFWRIRGAKGLIALAWCMGSYFAEQIRELDGS